MWGCIFFPIMIATVAYYPPFFNNPEFTFLSAFLAFSFSLPSEMHFY